MTELDAIRARADLAAGELINQKTGLPIIFHEERKHRPVRASARDVPTLLEIIDQVTPLIRAAQGFVQNDDDTGALERLVEVADQMPWKTLDTLGITEDDG